MSEAILSPPSGEGRNEEGELGGNCCCLGDRLSLVQSESCQELHEAVTEFGHALPCSNGQTRSALGTGSESGGHLLVSFSHYCIKHTR